MNSKFKFWIPNFITLSSLSLGVIAIMLVFSGKLSLALWLAFICMVLDRFDGMVARKIRATSNFGMEMDSLADMVSFGVVPALLLYFIVSTFSPHFQGNYKYIPMAVSVFWVVASGLRLAKFNITAQAGKFEQVFQGFPMPIAAGFLLAPSLVMMKYFPQTLYPIKSYDPRIVSVVSPSASTQFHWMFTALLIWGSFVAYGMISTLRVPKFKPPKIKWRRYYMMISAGTVYVLILLRAWPEWILFTSIEFLAISLFFHFTASKEAKGEYIPLTEVMSWKFDTSSETQRDEN